LNPSHIFIVNQDPWVVPHLFEIESLGSSMFLSAIDIFNQDIQSKAMENDDIFIILWK
jgi:hypothetical protein